MRIAAAVLFVLILPASLPAGDEAVPEVRQGRLDLRGYEFDRRGSVSLNGDWLFFAGEFVPPERFVGGALVLENPESAYLRVPSAWPAEVRYGTYYVNVHAPDISDAQRHRFYALKFLDLNTATVAYVNGVEVYRAGNPGTTAAETQPAFYPDLVVIPRAAELHIVVHIANFAHRRGGFDEPLTLGTERDLRRRHENDRNLALFVSGALGIMGFYQAILFLLRRQERLNLWFAVFCFALGLRNLVTGEYYLVRMFPEIPFELLLKIEYSTFAIGLAAAAMFLYHLFAREWSRTVLRLILFYAAAYIVLILSTPLIVYSIGLTLLQIVSVSTILYGIATTAVALWRGREGAGSILIGGSLFSATVILDIITSRNWLDFYRNTGPYGLIILILFQAYIVSRKSARAFATAERLSEDLEDRVVERTRELEESRRQAEEASRAKSDFLAVMSHEIRTPLNSIVGIAELLEESNLENEQRQYVRVLDRAGRNLLHQVNDILDFSRIEAGKLEMDESPFDPISVVEDTIAVFRFRAAARKDSVRLDEGELKLSMDLDFDAASGEPPLIVRGDAARLQQVLINLTGNAVKFTERGEVVVEAKVLRDLGDRVEFEFAVRDTGVGIPADKLEKIFDTFSQADSSNARRHEGTGLGLAISRRLVRLMHGDIHVESRPGQGSRFSFTAIFPRVAADEAAQFSMLHAGPRQEAEAFPADLKLRILLAEDNPDNQFLIQRFLKDTSLELELAENGRLAVEMFRLASYDLVLMDIQMPEMDGYAATGLIREFEQESGRAHTPVLALTANATNEDIRRTEAMGFDGYLTKPVGKQTLLNAILGAVQKQKFARSQNDVKS